MNASYLNGLKADNQVQISLYNPSFLYGISVFEGIRSYWNGRENKIFDLDLHLKRLYCSAEFISFKNLLPIEDLKQELLTIFETENIKSNVYIRITFFIGSETSWSEENNIYRLISIRSIDSYLENMTSTSLSISSFNRISSRAMPPSVKAGANYLNSRYALIEARNKGYQGALFLSDKNFVAESTGSCVFFIKDGVVYTPSEDCDILVGITRNRIIQLCLANQIQVKETHITPPMIYSFDAAFLAGTMIEIKPISKIELKEFNAIQNETFSSITRLFKEYVS
jgi:branched-chain amino acid aminotransferase